MRSKRAIEVCNSTETCSSRSTGWYSRACNAVNAITVPAVAAPAPPVEIRYPASR